MRGIYVEEDSEGRDYGWNVVFTFDRRQVCEKQERMVNGELKEGEHHDYSFTDYKFKKLYMRELESRSRVCPDYNTDNISLEKYDEDGHLALIVWKTKDIKN